MYFFHNVKRKKECYFATQRLLLVTKNTYYDFFEKKYVKSTNLHLFSEFETVGSSSPISQNVCTSLKKTACAF